MYIETILIYNFLFFCLFSITFCDIRKPFNVNDMVNTNLNILDIVKNNSICWYFLFKHVSCFFDFLLNNE